MFYDDHNQRHRCLSLSVLDRDSDQPDSRKPLDTQSGGTGEYGNNFYEVEYSF